MAKGKAKKGSGAKGKGGNALDAATLKIFAQKRKEVFSQGRLLLNIVEYKKDVEALKEIVGFNEDTITKLQNVTKDNLDDLLRLFTTRRDVFERRWDIPFAYTGVPAWDEFNARCYEFFSLFDGTFLNSDAVKIIMTERPAITEKGRIDYAPCLENGKYITVRIDLSKPKTEITNHIGDLYDFLSNSITVQKQEKRPKSLKISIDEFRRLNAEKEAGKSRYRMASERTGSYKNDVFRKEDERLKRAFEHYGSLIDGTEWKYPRSARRKAGRWTSANKENKNETAENHIEEIAKKAIIPEGDVTKDIEEFLKNWNVRELRPEP